MPLFDFDYVSLFTNGLVAIFVVLVSNGFLNYRRQRKEEMETEKIEKEAEKTAAETKNIYAETTDRQAQTLERAYEQIANLRKAMTGLENMLGQAQADRIKSDNALTNYKHETDKRLAKLGKDLEEAQEAAIGIQSVLDLELEKNMQLRKAYEDLKFEFHEYKRAMEQRMSHLLEENAMLKKSQNRPANSLATV